MTPTRGHAFLLLTRAPLPLGAKAPFTRDPGAACPHARLTCQAAELPLPHLEQAARAVSVGEPRRARVAEPREGQQLRPGLCRSASHGPSRQSRRGPGST